MVDVMITVMMMVVMMMMMVMMMPSSPSSKKFFLTFSPDHGMKISFLEKKILDFFGDDDDGDDDAIITIIKFHNIDQISQLWQNDDHPVKRMIRNLGCKMPSRAKNDDQSSQ